MKRLKIATPEHDKLHAIKDQSQAIYDFIQHLAHRGITLAETHHHTEDCEHQEMGHHAGFRYKCGAQEGELFPASINLRKQLAEFFGINEEHLEAEKRALLASIRQANVK